MRFSRDRGSFKILLRCYRFLRPFWPTALGIAATLIAVNAAALVTPQIIRGIVDRAADCGAQYLLPWIGMSLRDQQRAYYYQELDKLFPGLKQKYIRRYGDQYRCLAPNAEELADRLAEWCTERGLATQMPTFEPELDSQLPLF